MPEQDNPESDEPEIAAIARVYSALKDLDESAQHRVLDYVSAKLNIKRRSHTKAAEPSARERDADNADQSSQSGQASNSSQAESDVGTGDDELDGVSPVAKKWMRRNDLDAGAVSKIFSLGVDEIDLVAKKITGKNKKDKMRNVLLLKGVASYLGSGAARFKDDEAREICEHYSAYDAPNFAAHLKSFSSIISGNKTNGYTLTARGLTEATELIKALSGQHHAKPDN